MCNNGSNNSSFNNFLGQNHMQFNAGSDVLYKICDVKICIPQNMPCPEGILFPPFSMINVNNGGNNFNNNAVTNNAVQNQNGIIDNKPSSIPNFVNMGLIDFDVNFENGVVTVTISVAGVNLGTLTLNVENNCGAVSGKVDVFGVAGAKVELSVCVDFNSRQVCANGDATIKVLGQKVKVGSFHECVGF